jgi:hypothetical protein
MRLTDLPPAQAKRLAEAECRDPRSVAQLELAGWAASGQQGFTSQLVKRSTMLICINELDVRSEQIVVCPIKQGGTRRA